MITLRMAKLLQDNGLGTVAITGNETGKVIYWEKMPLNKNGVFIMSNGDPLDRSLVKTQSFDIFARGTSDVDGNKRLQEIAKFIGREYFTCELPIVAGVSEEEYTDCRISPTFNITNQGLDANDRVIWNASFKITYKEKS